MFFKFLAILIAASTLIYLGSLSVWVAVLGLAAKSLLAIVLTLILGIAGYALWRLYRQHRREQTSRLIFKGK